MIKAVQDDWQPKDIGELAWFLATGEQSCLPKLSAQEDRASLQIAYLQGFVKILDYLIRSTFFGANKRSPGNRLDNFAKETLYRWLIQNEKIWGQIHEVAQQWFIGEHSGSVATERSTKKEKAIFEAWAEDQWTKYLQRYKSQLDTDQLSLAVLQNRFNEEVLTPAKTERDSIQMEKDIRAGSRDARQFIKSRSALAKVAKENRKGNLWSPELNEPFRTAYYLDEVRKLKSRYGKTWHEHIKKRAANLFDTIQNSHMNSYLRNDDGSVPNIDEITHNLEDAGYLDLDHT